MRIDFYAQRNSALANQIPDDALYAIEEVVHRYPGGASAQEILRALAVPILFRTLQYRLKSLVTRNRLIMDGEGRWARYRMSHAAAAVRPAAPAARAEAEEPCSTSPVRGRDIYPQLCPAGTGSPQARRLRPQVPRSLSPECLLLPDSSRTLHAPGGRGRPQIAGQPAGTYAKQILDRLLIDLASEIRAAWKRNTYSLLDTKRLIELGEEAGGARASRSADDL